MAKNQGFASMTPEKRKAIASKGGKAAHAKGKAHKFNQETGQRAGFNGGRALFATKGRAYMVEIGRKGGLAKNERGMGFVNLKLQVEDSK
jgi:general stress protein YciG